MKRCKGATTAITLPGTPNKAAGNKKKVNILKKTEMLCRNAHARLNSSLLW